MRKKVIYPIFFIVLIIIGYLLINYPTTVGLADNSDYGRVLQPIGLASDQSVKFFYTQQDYLYDKEFLSLREHVGFIVNPRIENIAQYHSTHFIIIKCAQLLNGIIKYYKYGQINDFDIRALSHLYVMIFSLAIVLFIKSIPLKNSLLKVMLAAFVLFIYYDKGYMLYFNSFYGEPLILVSLLLYVACTLLIIRDEKKSYGLYILSFISGCIFIGAKVANIPLGLIMLLFSALLFYYKKHRRIRIIIIIGSIGMLVTSIYYFISVPKWMNDVNQYHSLFYGVLKDSSHPKEDLQDLGIDEKYLTLQNTHGYMDHKGYDIYSEDFRKEVYEKATPFKISLYYLTHPSRLLEKMEIAARSSTIIRPPYLGNYTKEDDDEVLKFDKRFSWWESLRKTTYRYSLLLIVIVFGLFIIMSYFSLFRVKATINKHQRILLIAFRIMLLIFAASQFVLPVIGNGEADLIKHMFLFNVLLDMMIILCFIDLSRFIELGKIKLSLGILSTAVCTLLVVIVINSNHENETITFGKYNNEEVVWEVIEETDEYYFLASKNIINYRQFANSHTNLWIDSDIRKWLNKDTKDGFLFQFNEQEKQKIVEIPRKTIVSPNRQAFIQIGEQPHYWYTIPGYVEQNYDVAFGAIHQEKVFLLSAKDVDKYAFKKRKEAMYWLRTPYTHEKIVRVVGKDGFVYHKETGQSDIGVVPCMYIKK